MRKLLLKIFILLVILPYFIFGNININEIYYNIPDYIGWNDSDQWFEIFNFSSNQISLESWKIKTSENEIFTFSLTINPNQRILFVADSSRFVAHWDTVLIPGTVIIEYGTSIDITRNSGEIKLLNANGEIITGVEWGGTGTATSVPEGYSLALFPEQIIYPQLEDYKTCIPTPSSENREAPPSAINSATWGRIKAMYSSERL